MIKESSSLYKMPYFNISENVLKYIGKVQNDYQEVVCICNEDGCNNDFGGFKYDFSYKATPTVEPVSYKLKGFAQEATLQYDDIGIDIRSDVTTEIYNKILEVNSLYTDALPEDIFDNIQNSFNNQKLTDNIFQRNNSYVYREEIYNATGYLNNIVPSFRISSNIYTINIQQSVVSQDNY